MKRFVFLMVLIGLMFFSCKKNVPGAVPTSLEGTWKMVLVTDNITNTSITKPSSIQGDVILTFVPNTATAGTFSGETPSNYIAQNDYLLAANHAISIPVLGMTKVMETSWGSLFVDNIRDAQQYSFGAGGELSLRTTHKILTFQKL